MPKIINGTNISFQKEQIDKCCDNTDKFIETFEKFDSFSMEQIQEMAFKTTEISMKISILNGRDLTFEESKDLSFGVCIYYQYCNKKYGKNWDFNLDILRGDNKYYFIADFDKNFTYLLNININSS